MSGAPFSCRPGCAACCVSISISSPLPGMPRGKRAGIACVNLSEEMLCRVYGSGEYPAVCANFAASAEMCGSSREEATAWLERLERLTAPDGPLGPRS